ISVDKSVTIFDFEISHQNPVNNFSFEKIDKQTISVNFDFIDYNDGVIMNIFHSRLRNTRFTVKGTFIGARKMAHGIRKDKLSTKANIISKPLDYYIKKNGFFSKLITVLLIIPTLIIYLPIILIVLPLDQILNKVNNKFER